MGEVTDLSEVRDKKEVDNLMEIKYLCGRCNNAIFMIYNGVAQCVVCDDIIKLDAFKIPTNT